MVDTGELAKYLNDSSCIEGDIAVILGEGNIEVIKNDDGSDKKVLNIPVETSGSASRKLIYTPGMKAVKLLQAAWGLNTKNWVGKKFSIKFVLMQIGKNEINVIKPVPIVEEKV